MVQRHRATIASRAHGHGAGSRVEHAGAMAAKSESEDGVTSIAEAKEAFLEVGKGKDSVPIELWYRTWGNSSGIPVLFVHGGPGNCVADYKDINAEFFDKGRFWVVEVDQRGTGRSRPSVRDGLGNARHYMDISIAQMSADFEAVREALGVERWLVFGGSWGSTLGLDYAERHAPRCLGLIVRGIFLSTEPEFDAVYARGSFEGNPRRLAEFDTFFEPAAAEAKRRGEPPLDPNDARRFIEIYHALIVGGDDEAAWRFHVFENNLVEEDESALLDPFKVDEGELPTALSVAFFESRLFLRGTFEEPVDLLGRVGSLNGVNTWVVQGTGDEVCPDVFARQLVERLAAEGVPHTAKFVDAGHRASSGGITVALKECVSEFAAAAVAKA